MRLLDALSDMFLPIEEMAEMLDVVRANGYGVGLLSNTCQSHWDWICNQPYLMNQFSFDVTVLSFEEHAMKPDSVICRSRRAKGRCFCWISFFSMTKQRMCRPLGIGAGLRSVV